MDLVTVEDYKILHFDGSETTVDTTLSLQGEYTFNFLRKDYFEYLPYQIWVKALIKWDMIFIKTLNPTDGS